MESDASNPLSRRDFRVFLSYSHQDHEMVRQVVAILQRNGLSPMWDENFAFGQGFHDQIKNFIAHAHVFLPILTAASNERKWVHQEIGFATALNVPVLPVAIGVAPGEMIYQLHAILINANDDGRIKLSDSDLARLEQILTYKTIEQLVERGARAGGALYECAEFPEIRARMMADYCEDVLALGQFGLVRQKGALSSFHIPTQTINHQIWSDRYGKVERSDEHCRLQRLERIALGRHAEARGCKLVINPYVSYEQYGLNARRVRLESLYDFLSKMTDDMCSVAILSNIDRAASNTIVGDWFAAESVSAVLGKGYFQTIFTRHAASIQDKIANFDSEFDELLDASSTRPEDSRRRAMEIVAEQAGSLSGPSRAGKS